MAWLLWLVWFGYALLWCWFVKRLCELARVAALAQRTLRVARLGTQQLGTQQLERQLLREEGAESAGPDAARPWPLSAVEGRIGSDPARLARALQLEIDNLVCGLPHTLRIAERICLPVGFLMALVAFGVFIVGGPVEAETMRDGASFDRAVQHGLMIQSSNAWTFAFASVMLGFVQRMLFLGLRKRVNEEVRTLRSSVRRVLQDALRAHGDP